MRFIKAFRVIIMVFALAAILTANAESQGKKGFMKGSQGESEDVGIQRVSIRPSGLIPVFPADVTCPEVASPFASPTRYDGSFRPSSRYGGLHGGIDLSLDEGTPLLAIASGKVIGMGVGGQALGIYLWLQHAPEETGLPFWVYSKYQHLSELPKHEIGDKVQAGQVITISGKTGTTGGHYGDSGYPHLHLTTLAGSSAKYERKGSKIIVEGLRNFDPVAIYLSGLKDFDEIERLPEDKKRVTIPYVSEKGSIHPAGSKVVWPVRCR